jgi:hypothetical protein
MREARAHRRVVGAQNMLGAANMLCCCALCPLPALAVGELYLCCIARCALIMIEARALSGSWRR